MKKAFGIITFFLLITGSVNSQNLFPAKIELNGDTVVAITISQMDTISARLIDCASVSLGDLLIDAQTREIDVCLSLGQKQADQISNQRSQISDLTDLSNIQGQIIRNKDQLIREQKRKNRNHLLIGVPVSFGVGVAVGLLAGLFGHR